jgi:hypothetical protein
MGAGDIRAIQGELGGFGGTLCRQFYRHRVDLWNEPIIGSRENAATAARRRSSTGGKNGSDLRLMCTATGIDVQAADPGVLIICEGAINFSGTFLSGTEMPPGANGINSPWRVFFRLPSMPPRNQPSC